MVVRMSFKRENLIYVVRHTDNKEAELIHILNSVQGSAIVYTRSRQNTKDVAKILSSNGISATFYHAGLDFAVKDQRQQDWQKDEVRVMVATNAFGMGIDKPDVRVVVHMDCPDSLEAYFQEAGRGGRDGNRAYAVLLYSRSDRRNLLTHVQSAKMHEAESLVREIVEPYGSSVAVVVVPLDGSAGFSINGDRQFLPASMIKLLVLAEFMDEVDSGKLRLDDTYVRNPNDIVDGSGKIQFEPAGTVYTYDDLARYMIMYSDNTATNVLIDIMGVATIQEKADELHLEKTRNVIPRQ